jgi:hypothetical protein
MTTQSAPFYWLTCDAPGCGVKSTEGGEYVAWEDEAQAVDNASDSEWSCIDGRDYCYEHAPDPTGGTE